jgi:hypothetical protein
LGGLAAAIYTVWHGYAGGSALQAKANGFEQVLSAVRKFAEEVASDTEADAKKIWHWLGTEMDQAQKALVADWQKLETLFSGKKASAPTPTAPPTTGG